MRRGITRWLVAGLLLMLGLAFPAAGIAFAGQGQAGQGHQAAQPADDTGGIDGRDREFLTVIRFANLWEIPMGKLATERGTTAAVKTAGATMLADHTKLNVAVKQLADKYGVQLPAKPKSSHQGWMNEISSKTGEDFDKTFATRLRGAHGSVFSTIAEVRGGTHNAAIRDFATQANNIVMKHMSLLEKTGYVSGSTGHFAEAGARSSAYPENTLSGGSLLAGAVIFVVVAAGTVMGVRILSGRATAK
jgi:predicted outer membrane protein